jgi:hypothetical protein
MSSLKPYLDTSKFKPAIAQRVANGFAAVMEQAEPASADPAPSGFRLNHRAIFTHNYGSAFLQPSAVDGTRRILLIVDFSGSMSGMWQEGGGAEFVWGLMQFARQGGCHLKIVLTGCSKGPAELPIDTPWEVFAALCPMFSQEAFADTMLRPLVGQMMEESDITICWTDGQLTDGYVDAIRWRERNINVVGACLGRSDTRAHHAKKGVVSLREAMQEYFHAAFIDTDPARIATQMATWIAACPLRDLQ